MMRLDKYANNHVGFIYFIVFGSIHVQWQRRFFCPKRRFRIVFDSYRFMPFQTPFEGKKKRRLNGVFLSANHKALIKTPFIVSDGPFYRLFY